jgi:hypothetical protein
MTSIAAFMQIIKPGNPTAIGCFIDNRAAHPVKRDPAVTARLWQSDVNFILAPFNRPAAQININLRPRPVIERVGQRNIIAAFYISHLFQQRGGQFFLDSLHLRRGFYGSGMIEGDASDRKEQHTDQANRTAHPMPGMKLLHPKGRNALLALGAGGSFIGLTIGQIPLKRYCFRVTHRQGTPESFWNISTYKTGYYPIASDNQYY